MKAYQAAEETILEEDEDTIVTRTIETRPVRTNNPVSTFSQHSHSTTFTSPSRRVNANASGTGAGISSIMKPVVITSEAPSTKVNIKATGPNLATGGSSTFIQGRDKSLRASTVSNIGVINSPTRFNYSAAQRHSGTRGFVRAGPRISNTRGGIGSATVQIGTARMTSPSPIVRLGHTTQPQASQSQAQSSTSSSHHHTSSHTTLQNQNIDYITTETITTRRKKNKKLELKIKALKDENARLLSKISDLQLEIGKMRVDGTKVYMLEKENKELRARNGRLMADNDALRKENENMRVHLAINENQKPPTIELPRNTNDDKKWEFMQSEIQRLSAELSRANDMFKDKDNLYIEIKSENINLRSENDRLQNALDQLHADLKELKHENKDQYETNNALNIENVNLRNKLENALRDLQKLEKDMSNDSRIKDLTDDLRRTRDLLEREKDKNGDILKQLADAAAQIQIGLHHEESHKKLLIELDDKNNQINLLREEIIKNSAEREALLSRINDLERVKPEDSDLMARNRNEIGALQERCDNYEVKIRELELMLEQMEREKKNLGDENEVVKSEFLLLERDYERLKADHEDRDTLNLIKNENENLKRLNEELQRELEHTRGKIGASNEYSELSKKLSDLEQRLTRDTGSTELAELKARNKELEKKVKYYERKEDKWAQLQKDVQRIKEEFNNDKLMIMNLSRDKSDLEKANRTAEKELGKKNELIQQLEAEVEEWRNKSLKLEKRFDFDDDENQNLHYVEEIEGLKQMINEKEEELALWQSEVRRLEDEIGHIEDGEQNIHELAGRVQALEEEIRMLSDENDKIRQENEELVSKLESANEIVQENENLRELLRQLRAKLQLQLQTNNLLWKRSQEELELKRKLREEINTKITLIQREATGETSEAARYYQQEISKIHAENERLTEENAHMQSRIDELKEEVQILRDEYIDPNVVNQEVEEDEEITQ